MHTEVGASRSLITEGVADLKQAFHSDPGAELGELRMDVAVLRERVGAAERMLAERDQRIRDLRGSLQIVAAGLLRNGGDRTDGIRGGSNRSPGELEGMRWLARVREVLLESARTGN